LFKGITVLRFGPLRFSEQGISTRRVLEGAALVVILLLAAWLRLGWPGVNSFAFDEAHLSLIALEMARGGELARVGMPSSVGVPNLPAAAWVFSLPYLISPDPLLATRFTGLLSLLAVIGTWALARQVWGGGAGLAAALFLAASPYAVLYSRSIWAQNLLPVIGLLWGWTAFLAAARGNRLALGVHVYLAGFAFQVHFAGAALILPTIYFFARFRWWRAIVPVLMGGGLALLALLPFVMEVACCRPDILDQYRAALGGDIRYDLAGFVQLALLALGLDWGFLLLGDRQPPDSPLLAGIVVVLLAAGLIQLLGTILRAQRRPDSAVLAEIILVWLVASPLFFARHSSPVLLHYHLAGLPALALLAGAALGYAGTQRVRPVGWDAVLFLAVIIAALVWTNQLARSFDLAGRIETPNGLGTPLRFTREAASNLPDNAPVIFFTHGDDPNVDGEAAVFAALWWGRDYRIVPGGSLLILPNRAAYLMATLDAIQAWEEIDAAGLARDTQTFDRREGAKPFMLTFYDGSTAPAGFTLLDEPVQLSDGVQLEGWKARRVGPRLRISTLWRVMDTPAPGTYQQFHHLRTADTLAAEQPAAVSDVPLAAHRWQAGDRLVVMGDFFVDEAGPLWVDVGHYTLPDLRRIPHADGETAMIRLGPFTNG